MSRIKISKPEDGWISATEDDLQKLSANILGEKHCINPQSIYDAFNKMEIYIPTVMHHLMRKTLDTNIALIALIINKDESLILEVIEP